MLSFHNGDLDMKIKFNKEKEIISMSHYPFALYEESAISNYKSSDIFLEENKEKLEKIGWSKILRINQLSEQQLEKYYSYCHWNDILFWQKNISENFIRLHTVDFNASNWYTLFWKQKVSEDFIDEFVDIFPMECWEYISGYMDLSANFIKKHKEIISNYE